MFTKILIANRGEIACRVIESARKLGIKTVAVYSDADANSRHVAMADEAFHIGPSPARESYLLGENVLQIAKRSGAQAIHPGYGFLSENAEFCRACAANDIVFIGPPVAAIEAMGSKSAAKRIMEGADVPLVPGYHGDDQSADLIRQSAEEMGYPVLLKATAGGGGKGMRIVWSGEEFDEALAAAKRESLNSFSDDRMLVEKYLTQPRHVEIQVFCDGHGNGVFLAERDCSVQRRHQKVIEEAPAPGMTNELRAAMGETALCAAKAIDYEGAGTVEFLLDTDGTYYFMEMNTRLQVEHPVTEMITGVDLVEWQLRVAAGEVLPKTQEQISINGHAFEARIYAEDPANDFLPVTGKLQYLRPPKLSSSVRVDTGVVQGDEISVHYDPMIAKLIVWGDNRKEALRKLSRALADYHIAGTTTNIEFLQALATSAPFANEELDTGFIEKHAALLAPREVDEATRQKITSIAALYVVQQRKSAGSVFGGANNPWASNSAWRMNQTAETILPLRILGQELQVTVSDERNGLTVQVQDTAHKAQASLQGERFVVELDDARIVSKVVELDEVYRIYVDDRSYDVEVIMPDLGDEAAGAADNHLTAPMNGTVVQLLVELGQSIEQDDALLVMEAMKMEHTIRAPSSGVVKAFYYQPGDLVDGGAELLDFEPADSKE